jgi:hypothetical protein
MKDWLQYLYLSSSFMEILLVQETYPGLLVYGSKILRTGRKRGKT